MRIKKWMKGICEYCRIEDDVILNDQKKMVCVKCLKI